jgi:flagellar biosynthesis chaperone FliJ
VAVSRALRRLLRVRELEEEQCRLALEAASAELNKLQNAMASAFERGRRGRRLIAASAGSGELSDRLSGIEEIRTSARFVEVLQPHIAKQEEVVALRRQEFMAKRLERRQAETLIEKMAEEQAIVEGRRSQQALDDWFSNKLYREGAQQEPSSARAAEEDRPAKHVKRHSNENLEKNSTM